MYVFQVSNMALSYRVSDIWEICAKCGAFNHFVVSCGVNASEAELNIDLLEVKNTHSADASIHAGVIKNRWKIRLWNSN